MDKSLRLRLKVVPIELGCHLAGCADKMLPMLREDFERTATDALAVADLPITDVVPINTPKPKRGKSGGKADTLK